MKKKIPDRPNFDHGGNRYERQRGTWLSNGLTVSKALSHELDAKAKQDPDLWERCEAQDFEDDPRHRGMVRLPGVSIVDLELDSDEVQRPAPGYQSTSGHRRKRDLEHLDWEFKKDGVLLLTGDIAGGWRPTEQAWYFHASAPVQLPVDYVLSCVATIVEDTSGRWHRRSVVTNQDSRDVGDECASIAQAVPSFATLDKVVGPIRYSLRDSACIFSVTLLNSTSGLNSDLPWSFQKDHWQFGFVEYGLYEVPVRLHGHLASESRPFSIELRCTLHRPPRPERQAEYEYDTPFPSAGLPSLGKRR